MTSAELIKALKACSNNCSCDKCPFGEQEECPSMESMMSDAADALEAAEHRIEDLEGALAACRARKDGRMPKEGEWISNYDGFEYDVHCSVCGEEALIKEGGSHDHAFSRYCPNCGARMRGEQDG